MEAFNNSLKAWENFSTDTSRYQAIVTDWMMPGMSGVELIERIKYLRPSIPIVVISGWSEGQKLTGEPSWKHLAWLHKPVPGGDLARALRKILDEEKTIS